MAAALWYADKGLHVFAIQPGLKLPYKGTRGCLDATTDVAQVAAWWADHPDANVAIATGHTVDVIDVDGYAGQAALAAMDEWPEPTADPWADRAAFHQALGVVAVVSTPRPGGVHLWRTAQGHGNRAKMLPGIDYRGAGGYVLVPPSVVTEPPHPGTYRFLTPPVLP